MKNTKVLLSDYTQFVAISNCWRNRCFLFAENVADSSHHIHQ